MAEMNKDTWAMAHILAAELALNQVSKNLVQDLIEYLHTYPQATMAEYAERLVQLNIRGYFLAGKSGEFERPDLGAALQRVPGWTSDTDRTCLILGWASRLIEYYAQNPPRAMKMSALEFVDVQQGMHFEGLVRDGDKDRVWVRIASGQWGRAARAKDVDLGDRVRVVVQSARSAIDFNVEIVEVLEYRQRSTKPSIPEEPPTAPELEEGVSDAAKAFMAFLNSQKPKEK